MANIAIWKLNTSENAYPKIETVSIEPAPKSLNVASHFLPAGVYTTFRTYGMTRILPLDDHVHRLEESACLLGYPILLDIQEVYLALHQAVYSFLPQVDLRIRLSLDLESHMGDLYLALELLEVPSIVEYEKGVTVATISYQRENPHSKQTSFIQTAETIRSKVPADIHEVLLLDEKGCILEGLTSNFFAVKQNALWTAERHILTGITRSLVIEAAANENIPVHLVGISTKEIPLLQEAFITSSSRSILPVRQINESMINGGNPGPVTRRLARAYWREIDARLVEI